MGAGLTGDHVQAGLEQHCCRVIRANKAIPQDSPEMDILISNLMVSPVVPVIDILLAEKTLLNPWGTPRTDCDMTTGSKKDISALVGANQALVQQLILRTAYHAITSDDALTGSELKDWSRTKVAQPASPGCGLFALDHTFVAPCIGLGPGKDQEGSTSGVDHKGKKCLPN